jgi:hypothetical protein
MAGLVPATQPTRVRAAKSFGSQTLAHWVAGPNPAMARSEVARARRPSYFRGQAGLAQLVEHLICNQGVAGSIPAAGTTCDE